MPKNRPLKKTPPPRATTRPTTRAKVKKSAATSTSLVIPDSEESFGQALRWLRTQRRMTIHQLSSQLEPKASTRSTLQTAQELNDIEHNRKDMSPERIIAVAKILDTPVVGLLLRRGRKPSLRKELRDWLEKDPGFAAFLEGQGIYRPERGVLRPPCLCGCSHCCPTF